MVRKVVGSEEISILYPNFSIFPISIFVYLTISPSFSIYLYISIYLSTYLSIFISPFPSSFDIVRSWACFHMFHILHNQSSQKNKQTVGQLRQPFQEICISMQLLELFGSEQLLHNQSLKDIKTLKTDREEEEKRERDRERSQ